MLPTGHIAAGYLTGLALLKFSGSGLTPNEQHGLLLWTTFWGAAPDFDVFYYFIKHRTLLVSKGTSSNHRSYISHAPMLWLAVSLLIYFVGTTLYVKLFALSILFGSFSHFILDSVEYGIMWLWPISNKIYALKDREVKFSIQETNLFKHSWEFIKLYSTKVTFYLEILIITLAIIIYFK